MKKAMTLLALLGAALLVLGGCDLIGGITGGQEMPLPQMVEIPPPPVPGMLPDVPPVPEVPALPEIPPAAGGGTPDFQWTETPAVNLIPDAPLAGMANGQPFTAQSVVFEPGADSWKMVIRDQPLVNPTDTVGDGQFITVNLPVPPTAGMTWMRPMSYGDGFFQVRYDQANPDQTTSWNADNAWALEITGWQAADWNSSGPSAQYAGQASGRIAVCYKGSGNMQNSWVAGRFENAIIRYMGEPYWARGVASGTAPATGKTATGKGSLEKKISDLVDQAPGDPPPAADPPPSEPPPAGSGEPAKPVQIDMEKLKSSFQELKKKARELQQTE